MGATSFADHLDALDDDSVVALLHLRPDACVEPVPSDMARLADRLCSPASLGPVLPCLDQDTLEVGRAIAVLGTKATTRAVADLLDAPADLVERPVAEMTRRGLAWRDGARLKLPERLASHWQADIGGGSSITALAGSVLVDDLRRLAQANDIDTQGLRKPELVEALSTAWSDRAALSRRIARLRESTRQRLVSRSLGEFTGIPGVSAMDDKRLVEAGLLLRLGHRTVVPHEVALAAWLTSARLTGVPDLPAATDGERSRASAEAAAHEALRLVTTVLDDATTTPIPTLKNGGVGKRERARLAKRLALSDDESVCLVIDVAFAAGLLGAARDGYAPTKAYTWWREQDAAARWAALATSWFGLTVAPTARFDDGGKEVAPPLPMATPAGIVRRALLAAAAPDRSVSATAPLIDWFCPLHQCEPEWVARLLHVAMTEARWFGAIAGDAVSELGQALVGAERGVDVVAAAAELLADPTCQVVLQSDLTAVVSGRPDASTTRLLTLAADAETRGSATTYRFSPSGVRRALDAGWDAEGLRAALTSLSDRPLPQPLDYLIGDVARRHGEVHVRPARTCVVAEPPLVEELLRSRALRALGWSRLAPTVLCSPQEPQQVLAKLRSDGYFPVQEDESGAVVLEGAAASGGEARGRVARDSLSPEKLVARLREGPRTADSATVHLLADLNPRLDGAELELLADAVDRHRRVHITYRDQNGTISYRTVTPERVMHRWLAAWCHLRNGEREFTVASIQAVAPPTE